MINFNFDGLNLGCIKNSILKWKKVQEVEYYSKVKFINIYLLKMKMKMKRVGGGGGYVECFGAVVCCGMSLSKLTRKDS